MKKMLLVFPHPDDESFTCGGLIPKYEKAGWQIELVCATLGQAGTSGPYEVEGDALGSIRRKELEKAGKILGIHAVTFLGYYDGKLFPINPGELEDKVYQKMVAFAPDVVITFEPNGISNHPDHMKLTLATTVAFQRYNASLEDAREVVNKVKRQEPGVAVRHFAMKYKTELKEKAFADVLESIDEPKLYYACVPESVVTFLIKRKIFPPESFGKPFGGTPDRNITTVINIERFLSKKIKALAAHETQRADVERFVAIDNQPLVKNEYFILRMQGATEVFMGKNDRVSDRL